MCRHSRRIGFEIRIFLKTGKSKRDRPSSAGPARTLYLGRLFELPPADRLLETFDRFQPLAGARIIVLSEHVDYWNRLGWADPFSSAVFTQRQQEYVNRFHLASAYTPQLVIDGRKDVVGSDERAIRAAILKAEAQAKASIELKAQRAGSAVDLDIDARGAGVGTKVYIAVAEDHVQSQVTRGENVGRNLHHVAVVRSLLLAAKTDERGTFVKRLRLSLNEADGAELRAVVFLQDSDFRVLGADETRL